MTSLPTLTLPNASVIRVAKENIPDTIRISKPAQEGLNKAACVFALALGVIAGDIAREHKRSTMAPNHVLRALDELRFGSFIPPLKEGLNALKTIKQDKRVAKKQKIENVQIENEEDMTIEGEDEDDLVNDVTGEEGKEERKEEEREEKEKHSGETRMNKEETVAQIKDTMNEE
jgi:down-regulator of transcription 1